MRILLISYYFAPQNLIGAVRPTKLAKYLSRMGHEVTVICGAGRDGAIDPTLQRDMAQLSDVHIIREWNPLRTWLQKKEGRLKPASSPTSASIVPQKQGLVKRGVLFVTDQVYVGLRWLSDVSFCRLGQKELRKLQGSYDAVFSTYAPYSVHQIARKVKASGLAKRWIADFRDEVGMPFRFQEGQKRRYLRMLQREADVLSAVSHGFLDMMGFADAGRVLSNGFDREDLPDVEEAATDGCLRVVYCGQLRDSRREVGERDVTPLFRALAALVQEGRLDKEQLRLVYAGREGALFAHQAAESGLEGCVEDHGQVSREGSIALQKGADILLMASHHLSAQRGILTGKLFEYMMMDKPIVCCMAGDLPNSGVKRVLDETGMGICCEAANKEQDEAALLSWLRTVVICWQNGQSLLGSQKADAVEAYAYEGLARTLSVWMLEGSENT